MNKTKIIIGITIVFIVLIIMAIWPALKSGNEAYNTVAPVQQEDIASTELATPELPAVADEALVEEQASSVTMDEDSVDAALVPEELAINETAATVEATTAVTHEAVEPVTPTAAPTTSAAVEGLYSVVDGNKLDASSYAGFKLFRNWCARCHGTYGQGMVGPDLAESLKFLSQEQFNDVVENGKTGTIGSMPGWKANVEVMDNLDQLYAYLKARSDGAIGVEKPQQQ